MPSQSSSHLSHLTRRFAEVHEALFELVATLHAQNAATTATRDLLLPRMMDGQLIFPTSTLLT